MKNPENIRIGMHMAGTIKIPIYKNITHLKITFSLYIFVYFTCMPNAAPAMKPNKIS